MIIKAVATVLIRAFFNGGTISKIWLGIQWKVSERWDTISY
jgi:hypothetical protein